METHDSIVIVSSARTPIGELLGALSTLTTPQLGALAIQATLERAGLEGSEIDEVIMGCVLPAGLGQAPARQAALYAGLPPSVHCSTINKVCGSGMQALILADTLLQTGQRQIIVAGGMESMSHAPYLLNNMRAGHRLGHGRVLDHMLLDGLEDAYEGLAMGVYAERTNEKYQFTRKEQDDFARQSLERAQEASQKGWFSSNLEITPVSIQSPKGEPFLVELDEHPQNVKIEKIPLLKPSFQVNGSVTAANTSPIADGAAALLLMPLSQAKKRNLKPIAKILGHACFSQEPAWFTTAPVKAIQHLLNQLSWTKDKPDLYEINEAFATVPLVVMRELKIPHAKINVHGGACALGHPIGASGARIVTTLLGALQRQDKRLGIAALCIGGGEATAIAIERL